MFKDGSRVLCGGSGGWVRWDETERRMKLCFIRYFILVFQDKVNAALTIWGQSGIRSVLPIPRGGAVGSRGAVVSVKIFFRKDIF